MLYYCRFYHGSASAVTRIQEGLGQKKNEQRRIKNKINTGSKDFKTKYHQRTYDQLLTPCMLQFPPKREVTKV